MNFNTMDVIFAYNLLKRSAQITRANFTAPVTRSVEGHATMIDGMMIEEALIVAVIVIMTVIAKVIDVAIMIDTGKLDLAQDHLLVSTEEDLHLDTTEIFHLEENLEGVGETVRRITVEVIAIATKRDEVEAVAGISSPFIKAFVQYATVNSLWV